MIVDLLAAIASLLLLGVAFALQLDRIEFAAGYLATVRADGSFELRRQVGGVNYSDEGDEPPGVLRGKIYCSGGASPIAVNYRVVGCARGGSR